MRQYDVFENPSAKSRGAVPYLIVLQLDRASETSSVVVAGLTPLAAARTMARSKLYPIVRVGKRDFVLLTPNLAAMPRKLLAVSVANVEEAHRRIVEAIDMLFTGV